MLVFSQVLYALLLHCTFAHATSNRIVRLTEFHYENIGSDTGEKIEVVADGNSPLEAGWSLYLYNGANQKFYRKVDLPPGNSGSGVTYVVVEVPGLQNGPADGIALVDPSSNVVEFLCYEGTHVAVDGPAAGMLCTDVGVKESSATPVGQSVQLRGCGSSEQWVVGAASFGSANVATLHNLGIFNPNSADCCSRGCDGPMYINEFHYQNEGTDINEKVELVAENEFGDWSIWMYSSGNGKTYNHIDLPAGNPVIPISGFPGANIVVVNTPGLQNGPADGIAVVDLQHRVSEFICYDGTFTAVDGPAKGMTCTDIGIKETPCSSATTSIQRVGCIGEMSWAVARSSFGLENIVQDLSPNCGHS